MNPLHVDDFKSGLAALGIGFAVGVVAALFMYFFSSTLATVGKTISGS